MEEQCGSLRDENDWVRRECGDGECLVGCEGLWGCCEGGVNFHLSVENDVEGALSLGRGEGKRPCTEMGVTV